MQSLTLSAGLLEGTLWTRLDLLTPSSVVCNSVKPDSLSATVLATSVSFLVALLCADSLTRPESDVISTSATQEKRYNWMNNWAGERLDPGDLPIHAELGGSTNTNSSSLFTPDAMRESRPLSGSSAADSSCLDRYASS